MTTIVYSKNNDLSDVFFCLANKQPSLKAQLDVQLVGLLASCFVWDLPVSVGEMLILVPTLLMVPKSQTTTWDGAKTQ